MQNGFRPDRRGEDNLFILTSAVELCRRRSKETDLLFLGLLESVRQSEQESPMGETGELRDEFDLNRVTSRHIHG